MPYHSQNGRGLVVSHAVHDVLDVVGSYHRSGHRMSRGLVEFQSGLVLFNHEQFVQAPIRFHLYTQNDVVIFTIARYIVLETTWGRDGRVREEI